MSLDEMALGFLLVVGFIIVMPIIWIVGDAYVRGIESFVEFGMLEIERWLSK